MVRDKLAPGASSDSIAETVRQAVIAGITGTGCLAKEKGILGEQLVERLLARALPPDFAIASTVGKTARGDYAVTCPDGGTVVVEVKNYQRDGTVNARDVEKFYRDVSAADAIGGILL